MVQFRDIQLKRQAREARKQDRLFFKRAVLVDEFGNQTSTSPLDDVWAVESERRVWYMHKGAVQPAQILCRKVSDPYVGLGVIIGYADGSNQLEVLSDDFFLTGTGDPTGWTSTAPRDFEPGGLKQMWVYSKVITPLATYPGTGLTVNVVAGDYPYAGSRKTFGGSVNFALTQNPNAGEHYLAGLYLDAANTLQVVYGASVVVATDPPEPSWPAGAFRLSAVRVNDTQTSIDFADDVFDRRMAWSDEQAGGGWPFANIWTVSTTDPDADYSTVTAAIAAASAGDGILLDIESSAETITVNKAVYLIGWARGGTVFTNSITITAAARLYNIKVTHESVVNARGFVCNQTDVAVLYNCEAVTNGSTTSRAIEQTAAGSTQVYGGYYESSGAGTSFEIFVSAGSVILYNEPTLFTSAVSGNVAGSFSNSGGGVKFTGAITLDFINAAGIGSGAWLTDESDLKRVKYTTLAAAVIAAASGDSIKLDTDTYSVSASQNIGVSVTIEGDGPEATIYTTSVSNAPIFDITADSITVVFRNLTLRHTGGGVAATGIFSNNASVTVVLDNCVLEITSGAGTSSRGLWVESGTWVLRNGSKITVTSGTSKYGIYNDVGAATITIGSSCEVNGATADIYGDQTGSALNIYGGLITHNLIDFAGAIERSGNISFERGRPNPIINGSFLVWQRGTSFAAIANAAYSADGWSYGKGGVMVHTVSQSSDVPTVAQSGMLVPYSLLVDCTTIDGTIAAGDFTFIRHKIEGFNFLHLAQRQFTLSFWVKATKTGVYCIAFSNSGTDRTYVAEYTVNTTDTWEYKTVTVSASPSAGTWDYTTGIGLSVTFTLATGSTFQTTANAWQTGGFLGTSNQVNACDDAANNFRLALVKLEPGAIATPFVLPDYEAERERCLRYVYVFDASSNTANQGQGAKTATANIQLTFQHPVPMRAATTLTHNITGYTAGNPGTTTIALVNYATNNFYTITGALTVARTNGNTVYTAFDFTAGTSWSDTAGNLTTLRIGPSVVAVLSAEL